MGSKSQPISMRNATSSHSGSTAPSLFPNTWLRQTWIPATVCVLGGQREKHGPWKHHFKISGRDSGLVASLLTKTLNSAMVETTYSLLGGWRRMSNTRSALFSRCLNTGHSLQPGLSASSITSPSHLHTHKQSQALPFSQQPRPPRSSEPFWRQHTEQSPGQVMGRQSHKAVPSLRA